MFNFPMRIYLLVGTCLLVLMLVSVASMSWVATRAQNKALKLELDASKEALNRVQAARKRDEAVLVARSKENAATALLGRSKRNALAQAAASAPAWADTPVPKEIQDALP